MANLCNPQEARRIGSSGQGPNESDLDQIKIRFTGWLAWARMPLYVWGLPLPDTAFARPIVAWLRYVRVIIADVARFIVLMLPVHRRPQ
jgi:hypothetical protein